jgi:phosphoribosylformylglycinamidine synthase
MLIIADQENKKKIFEIFQKWDLECAIIGEITDDNIYSVFFNDEIQFKERIINKKEINEDWVTDDKFVNRIEKKNDSIHEYNSDNEVINVIYKIQDDTLWNRYDFTIGNRTIKGPDQIGTYSIIKLPEVNKNLFVTWQSYNIDIISVNKLFNKFNVKPLCIVNCLNYGHPKEKINELSNFINVLSSFCNEYNIPIVGGNVSLYNSTDNKCITSTPVIVIIGIM